MTTHSVAHAEPASGLRTRTIALLGPVTVAVGVAWAVAQPWRITLLHPQGQGFWWLVVEPPIFVALAGLAFHRLIARPLLDDLAGEQ